MLTENGNFNREEKNNAMKEVYTALNEILECK